MNQLINKFIKGFLELKRSRFLKKMPKIIGIQSKSSPSFYIQYKKNQNTPIKYKASSICDSINVDYPLDGHFAYEYLKKTNGEMLVVDDKEILKAKKYLLTKFGINCCAASASTFAKLKKIIKTEKIKNKNILLLLTGTGFKDLNNN